MNELSTHIEYLLLHHDCVVIPHFGAFMTMMSTAHCEEGENLFFPPTRIVRFNPDFLSDDGLLAASVAATHDCDEVEARAIIQNMVVQLRGQLLTDGQVDFGTIGLFTQDEDGHIEFSACQAGATTPSLYGLDALSVKKLSVHHKAISDTEPDSSTHITINISRKAVRRTLAAAAAVMLCLMMYITFTEYGIPKVNLASMTLPSVSSPGNNDRIFDDYIKAFNEQSKEDDSQMEDVQAPTDNAAEEPATPVDVASVGSEEVAPVAATEPVAEPTEVVAPAANDVDSNAPVAAPSEAAASAKAAESAEVDESTPGITGYAIVLASATSRANAEAFVAELKKMGMDNACIYNNGRMNRVVLSGYTTEEEAIDAKHHLQWTHDGFDDAWLLRL